MEFQQANRSGFDRLIDGINRLPRPMMVFGVIGLFYAAMADPDWFIARMRGLEFVTEPLWWLLGAGVSFYFGARHHAKSTEFQSNMARYSAQSGARETAPDVQTSRNAAIADWHNDRS